jgi:hypothetical protein
MAAFRAYEFELSRALLDVLEETLGVTIYGLTYSKRLEEQWGMSLEDAKIHQPDKLWFMGSDCRQDGLVCSNVKLPQWGFADGRTARLRLMETTRKLAKD